jgi:hypothetical protein
MLEHDHSARQVPFNPFEAIVGVIIRPVSTMSAIAMARPWLFALILSSVLSLLSGLVTLTTPISSQWTPGMAGTEDLPPEFAQFIAWSQSPWLAVSSAIFAPLWLVVWTAILFVVARLFRSEGRFSGLLSTLGFASVPNIFLVPLLVLLNLGGAGMLLQLLQAGLSFVFGIWALILQVLGIRESLALSTGQAVLVLLIPFALLMLVACGLAFLVVMLVVVGIQATGS